MSAAVPASTGPTGSFTLDRPLGECSFLVTDRRVGTSVELAAF